MLFLCEYIVPGLVIMQTLIYQTLVVSYLYAIMLLCGFIMVMHLT